MTGGAMDAYDLICAAAACLATLLFSAQFVRRG